MDNELSRLPKGERALVKALELSMDRFLQTDKGTELAERVMTGFLQTEAGQAKAEELMEKFLASERGQKAAEHLVETADELPMFRPKTKPKTIDATFRVEP